MGHGAPTETVEEAAEAEGTVEREADEQTFREDVGFDGVNGVEACPADEANQAFREYVEKTAESDGCEETPPVGCWQFDGAGPWSSSSWTSLTLKRAAGRIAAGAATSAGAASRPRWSGNWLRCGRRPSS